MPFPQHLPQSFGQEAQFSSGPHLPSPHLGGQGPQSWGQLVQSSFGWQTPFPHDAVPQPPHLFLHSLTQIESHWFLQQYGSRLHTHCSQAQPSQPGVAFT
jgi:hypothetical protein